VAFTPDGRYAYATGYSSGIVSVINTARESVSAKIRVGDDAGAVAVSPDGRYVYLIDDDGIIVIDTGTNVVASTIYVGADGNVNGLTFSPDSDYAYIAGGGQWVNVIRTRGGTVPAAIDVKEGPSALAISPNGKTLYVATGYGVTFGANGKSRPIDSTVQVISTATETSLSRPV
jgi:YVTN family beta-propeller protein